MIFLTCILKSSVCAALLWIAYYALFRKETHFAFNRFYLLSVIPLSSIIPLLRLPLLPPAEHAPLVTIEGFSAEPLAETATQAFPTITLLLVIYFLGAGFVAFRFCKQLYHMRRIIAASRFSDTKNYSAFTFFRKICINSSTLPAGDYEKILWHEQVHAHQLHSVDLVVAQLFVMLQWFNPFAWQLKKSIVATHEYLADAQVLAHGVDVNIYQQLLFRQTTGVYPEYANGFSYSLTKKRLIMMTKNNTGKFFALKLCFMLPAIALPVALFGLSTAETVSPVTPTAASVETHTQAVDNVSKEPSVKFSVYTQDTKKDTAKTKKTDLTDKNVKKSKKEEVFLLGAVDVNPEFPGGQGEMMKFIFDNLKYPKEAAEKKIQGRVTVEFLVRTGGNVDNVKVLKSVDPLLDAEAVRVVKAMPAWTPGKHKGKTVTVRFILPIVFQMSKDKEAETK
ncbi:MAG: TonB family protein [Prevotellaceae bacterium]|jgi:TonB family protein|nr:TonB family protein [Prevotellaceae bacterium]